jgi:hypothetical protein
VISAHPYRTRPNPFPAAPGGFAPDPK